MENTFPFKVIKVCCDPVLDVGGPGTFDADGVNPSQIVARDGALYLYYIGYQRISQEIPYTILGGLAVSTDDGASFKRVHTTPMLRPVEEQRYLRSAPFVWQQEGRWQMLYIAGGEFFSGPGGKRLPRYMLRHTESPDGLNWDGPSRVLLQPDTSLGQIGFGRPVLMRKRGQNPELMLSIRSVDGYRLCAGPFSLDAPLDLASLQEVLPLSRDGWDSQMVCFGVTQELDGRDLLIYNGNQYGRSGFGLAWRDSAK
jgi:hypothetical protein